jgi:hypothetical protein
MEEQTMEIMGTEEGAMNFDPTEEQENRVREMVEEWRKCDKGKN